MEQSNDESALWALERLTKEKLSSNTICTLLKEILELHPNLIIPTSLQARILLSGLRGTEEVDDETLAQIKAMERLANIDAQEQVPGQEYTILPPPPDLILHIKTFLVAQLWRNNVAATPVDILRQLYRVFSRNPTDPADKARYEALVKASTTANHRLAIDRDLDGSPCIHGILSYVEAADVALGPTLYETVHEDIVDGLYVPGQRAFTTTAAAAAVAAVITAAQPPPSLQHPQRAGAARVAPVRKRRHKVVVEEEEADEPMQQAQRRPRPAGTINTTTNDNDEFFDAREDGGAASESEAGGGGGGHGGGGAAATVAVAPPAAKRLLLSGEFAELRDASAILQGLGGGDPLQAAIAKATAEEIEEITRRGQSVGVDMELAFDAVEGDDGGFGSPLVAPQFGTPHVPAPLFRPSPTQLQRQRPHPLTSPAAADAAAADAAHGATHAAAGEGTAERVRPQQRRMNKRWSPNEVEALLDGCQKYYKNWLMILNDNKALWGPHGADSESFSFHEGGSRGWFRTPVDLKDKWRNLEKAAHPEAMAIVQAAMDEYDADEAAAVQQNAVEVEEMEEGGQHAAQEDGAAAAAAVVVQEEEAAPEPTEEQNGEEEGEEEIGGGGGGQENEEASAREAVDPDAHEEVGIVTTRAQLRSKKEMPKRKSKRKSKK